MQPEVALKAISHLTIAISLLAILFVLLIALRKELISGEPFRGTVHLGLAVIGLLRSLP